MRRWTTLIGVIAALTAFATLSAFGASFDTTAAPRAADLPRIEAAHVTQATIDNAPDTATAAPDTGGSTGTSSTGSTQTGSSSDSKGSSSGKSSGGTAAASGSTSGGRGTSSSSGSTTGGSHAGSGASSGDSGHGGDHEVVAPPVHDSDENGQHDSRTQGH